MALPTAEKFAQRAFQLGLLTEQQLDSVWGEFRRRDVPLDDFYDVLLRREYLTNYQVERLQRGQASGFFYGEHKVLYLVGTGSFARVYRASQKSTGDIVAVKVLRKRFSEDPVQTEQFLHEGKMGMRLQHKNIVPIFDVESDGRYHFLTMEFVEGQSLREFVKIRKRLSPLEATQLIIDVVAGLDYAFHLGVTHRDLKMSNVLVSSRAEAKLVDFGLASYSHKITDDVISNHPNPRTIDYAGLERCSGVRKDDKQSDLYFAGTIYYHMLSGHPALHETKDRILRLSATRFQEIVPITHHVPNLPRPVLNVVHRAMELNPKRRYPTPQDMLAELTQARDRLTDMASSGELADEAYTGQVDSAESREPEVEQEGHAKTVMIVESNIAMQNLLRDQLKKYGYRVLVISDAERALSRFQLESDAPADCVVFSANSLGEEALDAFNRFAEFGKTKSHPAMLLLDEKHKLLKRQAETAAHRAVVVMPVPMSKFREVLKELILTRYI
jgi:serine/threonine protein kinase